MLSFFDYPAANLSARPEEVVANVRMLAEPFRLLDTKSVAEVASLAINKGLMVSGRVLRLRCGSHYST